MRLYTAAKILMAGHDALSQVHLPGGSNVMNLDRETIASALVGTGGAWLIGSAVLNGRSGRWNRAQVKGLLFAGTGFIMSAAAARWLQHWGNGGIAVSLVGTLFAMRGMFILMRERAARRAEDKPPRSK